MPSPTPTNTSIWQLHVLDRQAGGLRPQDILIYRSVGRQGSTFYRLSFGKLGSEKKSRATAWTMRACTLRRQERTKPAAQHLSLDRREVDQVLEVSTLAGADFTKADDGRKTAFLHAAASRGRLRHNVGAMTRAGSGVNPSDMM